MSFSYSNCFLCGCLLEDGGSVEHVFPKWLQNKYDLWDQTVKLLNRTSIPYRLLTIPCCQTCNTLYLSQLENTVSKSAEDGFHSFAQLGRLTVYQWVLKIFYGLLFKELSLHVERRDPEAGFIMTPDFLEELRHLHIFLQSVRTPFEFAGFQPWSIFIVEIASSSGESDFDYHDNLLSLTFGIRFGHVGVLACLEDRGAQEELYSDYWERFKGVRLHPMQFSELFAKVTYRASLMNRVPKFTMVRPEGGDQKVTVASPPLQGFSTAPIWEDWKQKEYAKVLAYYLGRYGLKFEDVYREPDLVLSLVEDENGNIPSLGAQNT
jgi:hypothetical protein